MKYLLATLFSIFASTSVRAELSGCDALDAAQDKIRCGRLGQTCVDLNRTIGNTPLAKLETVNPRTKEKQIIHLKLEGENPGGSIKDRVALAMILAAERDGRLKPGGTVIEATSGNTGIGVAMIAAKRGYRCVIFMEAKNRGEKEEILKSLGAEVVITPDGVAPNDPQSKRILAAERARATKGAVFLDQYNNPANPEAHYRFTAPELYQQMEGKVDAVFVGMGTGGTITGIGRFFKENSPNTVIIGVEPVGSIYQHYRETGQILPAQKNRLEGIGQNDLPSVVNLNFVDEILQIDAGPAFDRTINLLAELDVFAGGSSGAAVEAAIRYLRVHPELKRVAVILPDSGNRYVSKIFSREWLNSVK